MEPLSPTNPVQEQWSVYRPQGVTLSGVGHYLPSEVVDNAQLIRESGLPITPEWIAKRIGVLQRHRVTSEQVTSDLALEAAHMALKNAGLNPEDINAIILSTISPDHPNPSTACALQAKLGLGQSHIPCVDISAACSGFIYGLDMASRYVQTEMQHVLLVSAEIRSRFINPQDPSTYPIFGDGAAAVVVSRGDSHIKGVRSMADGQGYLSVYIPAGGSAKPASLATVENLEHFIHMNNGQKIFFEVVEGMSSYAQRFLADCGLTLEDIDCVIAHQANLHILKEVQRRLKLPDEKMLITIQQTGNTSSASIPIALSQAVQSGQITSGSTLLMVAAGAGHTMGLAVVKYP